VKLYSPFGEYIEIAGAGELVFDWLPAFRRNVPDIFKTCRNWQFAVWAVEKGLLDVCGSKRPADMLFY
jgi:hypothetical protein